MKNPPKLTRLVGYAFLFQFITSFSSGQFLRPTWLVAGDMQTTMLKIAAIQQGV